MVYIEIKIIKGKKYRYERTSYRVRVDGRSVVKHKSKYLGPVDPVGKRTNPNAGRKPAIFVKDLSEENKKAIELAKKSNDAFTRDRAKILLFSSEKIELITIAKKLRCDVRKVRRAIKDFNSKEQIALQKGKAKGAIPKFDEAKKKIILSHFSKNPAEFNYHFTTWTLPRFRKHLIDHKIVDSISIETVRTILDKAGAKLKRSKRWQYSPDKDFSKKNKK